MNITVLDKTQSSAMLRWSVGVMSLFPRELIHKIEYKSQWDSHPEHWNVSVDKFFFFFLYNIHIITDSDKIVVINGHVRFRQSVNVNDVCNASLTSNQTNSANKTNCRKQDKDYYYFNVTDLKYPFTHYDFRIYVRSSVARGDDKWSAPGCITLKTKPTSK